MSENRWGGGQNVSAQRRRGAHPFVTQRPNTTHKYAPGEFHALGHLVCGPRRGAFPAADEQSGDGRLVLGHRHGGFLVVATVVIVVDGEAIAVPLASDPGQRDVLGPAGDLLPVEAVLVGFDDHDAVRSRVAEPTRLDARRHHVAGVLGALAGHGPLLALLVQVLAGIGQVLQELGHAVVELGLEGLCLGALALQLCARWTLGEVATAHRRVEDDDGLDGQEVPEELQLVGGLERRRRRRMREEA